MTNKFDPQGGDKIICNNGEEYICCTKKFLTEKGCATSCYKSGIFAYREDEQNETTGVEWTYFNEEGEGYYDIREVIPQSVESSADEKEEVKGEPRYTLQEIKEAWDASGWVSAISCWDNFQKNLTKINLPEYQEYLRLKAIYE